MTYSQEQYDALLAVCRSYKQEVERLEAEFKQLETNAEILARGVRDLNHENYKLTEKIKQVQIEEIAEFDKLCYDYNKLLYIIRCNMTSITRYVRNENEAYDTRYKELAEKAVENILEVINHRGKRMRDIIFRGKRVGYNDWVYGNRIHDDVMNRDCYLGPYAVLPETIGQFTGACDKNGKKIFEGDIVESPHGTRGVVEWHRATCAFLVNIGDDWQTMDDCPYEVISNIYDNTEE